MLPVFVFFLVSGFCSVLYELVWLRLSMAQFGITTALVSIVLSTFMAGLGLGSWGSGYLIRRFEKNLAWSALRLYGATEFLIGISALLVPHELLWGRALLEHWNLSSSPAYYLGSGLWVALALMPWCACMGATIPLGMLCIRRAHAKESSRSFSYLYLANVLGAVGGSIIPLFFIELCGFRGTLRIGAALNFLLTASAFALSIRQPESSEAAGSSTPAPVTVPGQTIKPLVVLFVSGLTSMGMEVVWIRLFTPYIGTVVYAFAEILCSYLIATFLGSRLYRQWSGSPNPKPILTWIWPLLGLSALLPLVTAGTGFPANGGQRVWLGLILFSSILGFITPLLVDRWSLGDPDRAGQAYAVNVLGCILGPLLSGFLLLPSMSERWALAVLSAPWFLLSLFPQWLFSDNNAAPRRIRTRQAVAAVGALVLGVVFVAAARDFGTQFLHREILRDDTATVIATGQGMQRRLLVNGVGITYLTPDTKIMAHLPLASLSHPPRNALVICFGMGTTYRSVLSWGIPATVVELVPSVPRLFGYYHPDGAQLLRSPLSHVVIDDGRRYLERTDQKFDVITLDPPPPVQAAGSSLLYSTQFYALVKLRLSPGGILQTWLPLAGSDAAVRSAIAKALKASFPYVRVFGSLDCPGYHFLASDRPIPDWTPQQLVSHMPTKAIADMMEWGPEHTSQQQFAALLSTEFPIDQLIAEDPGIPPLQDDRPVNEYFFLRQYVPRLVGDIRLSAVHRLHW